MNRVARETVLPVGPSRGRIIVSSEVAQRTRNALRESSGEEGEPHEGLVYWAGRIVELDTYVLAAVLPRCSHGPYRVMADASAMGDAAAIARSHRLGIVAQVHSHPSDDTRHSDGDDHLIFMPFEGMFSIVVGEYGNGSLDPKHGAGFHQFQDGRWVRIRPNDEPLLI
ncbi:MAG: Mov34/MPN/PAD-1 family protein, partial [Polyangiaceae bacterium]